MLRRLLWPVGFLCQRESAQPDYDRQRAARPEVFVRERSCKHSNSSGRIVCRARTVIQNERTLHMNNQNFTTGFSVDQTPEQAFAAINNPRGWWSEAIE